ncbi:MAG TPA: FMN-binding negative transcriptional regulator [Candidatus Binatia bacterium]|nr:FMN-binding negative transcriptional regulator [Candidatus Binatia bacterium]
MYIPEHFRVRHNEDAIAFLRANPFAILISSTENGPFATHLPLFVDAQDEKLLLRGHVARANPHWRYLEAGPQCLAIFHGPHSYISPTNYSASDSVPTWNYAAVHVYGEARLFTSEADLRGMLNDLIHTFEPSYNEQWENATPSFRENMLRQIVGFEITATRIEGKFKLSQNRTRDDQARVIASIEESTDSTVSGVAEMMKQQGLGLQHAEREEKK